MLTKFSSYISELESRVEWLESIISQNLPDIDLDGGPGYRSRKKIVPKLIEPQDNVERNLWIRKNRSSNDTNLEEISDQLGFLSVGTGTDIDTSDHQADGSLQNIFLPALEIELKSRKRKIASVMAIH